MNGYLSLELGGKKRGIKFGNRALLDFSGKYGLLNGENLTFSFEVISDLVYFGLMNNCMITKESPDFNLEDVAIWLDEIPLELLTDVFKVFIESYTVSNSPGKSKKK